jgi:hypothetical protein
MNSIIKYTSNKESRCISIGNVIDVYNIRLLTSDINEMITRFYEENSGNAECKITYTIHCTNCYLTPVLNFMDFVIETKRKIPNVTFTAIIDSIIVGSALFMCLVADTVLMNNNSKILFMHPIEEMRLSTCKYIHEYDNIPDHLYDFVVKNTSTETANKLFKNDKLWLNQDECLDMKIIDVILL